MPQVEARFRLTTSLAGANELGDNVGPWHTVCEGAFDGLAGVLRDFETDLVVQHKRSDGEAEGGHCLINLFDVGAFGQQYRRLIHHHAQYARGVKARRVTDHDDCLAHLCPDCDRGLNGPVGCPVWADDLEQRHSLRR